MVSRIFLNILRQGVLYDFRSQLYSKLQAQSFQFYDQTRGTGLLMNRMVGDLQAFRQLLNTGYVQVIEGVFSIITTVPNGDFKW